MSGERYEPTPVPTDLNQLGEYLQRELRRIGSVFSVMSRVVAGAGVPEGSVAAKVGTIYLRTDSSATVAFYVKQSGSGNTGWVAK